MEIEKAVPVSTRKKLQEAGYELKEGLGLLTTFYGVVRRTAKSPWEAVSEPRYDGQAITQSK